MRPELIVGGIIFLLMILPGTSVMLMLRSKRS
jgi:hypothetical protein